MDLLRGYVSFRLESWTTDLEACEATSKHILRCSNLEEPIIVSAPNLLIGSTRHARFPGQAGQGQHQKLVISARPWVPMVSLSQGHEARTIAQACHSSRTRRLALAAGSAISTRSAAASSERFWLGTGDIAWQNSCQQNSCHQPALHSHLALG